MKRARPDGAGVAATPRLRYVNLLWCSLGGLRCVRVVPVVVKEGKEEDDSDVASWLPQPCPTASLSRACITLPCHADIPSPGAGVPSDGDVILTVLHPGVDLRRLPWRPQHFLAPVTLCDPLSKAPWSLCPRACLARLVAHVERCHGIHFRAGFEVEFAVAELGNQQFGWEDRRTYCSSGAFDAAAPMLEDMAETLQLLGLTVEQLHKESGPGQFEIVLGHCPVLDSVDNLLLAREAVTAVAHRHQRRATFLPKYLANQAGNGCHVHISLWQEGKNLLHASPPPSPPPKDLDAVLDAYGAADRFAPTVRHFLGGVHALLPALMCFTTPTPQSFRRIQPGAWAGAFQGWGIGNKEVPLRLPVQSVEKGLFTNVELKLCDATANPYMAVASVLAAGLVGLEGGGGGHKETPWDLPPPIRGDPGQLTPEERAQQGIRALPTDWAAAKAALMAPQAAGLRKHLGEGLVQACVAVRDSEWKTLAGMSLEEEVAFLFDRY